MWYMLIDLLSLFDFGCETKVCDNCSQVSIRMLLDKAILCVCVHCVVVQLYVIVCDDSCMYIKSTIDSDS